MLIKSNNYKNLQNWLYNLLAKIENNPQYTVKEIKKDIAKVLGDIVGAETDVILAVVKEDVDNINDQKNA